MAPDTPTSHTRDFSSVATRCSPAYSEASVVAHFGRRLGQPVVPDPENRQDCALRLSRRAEVQAEDDSPVFMNDMNNLEKMILVNKIQAGFYDAIQEAEERHGREGYAKNKSANVFTRLWANLRYKQHAAVKEAGVADAVLAAHKRWAIQKKGGRFLEIGCFSGSRFTFDLVEQSSSYTGIELSPKAVDALNRKLAQIGLNHKAAAVAGDFLEFSSEEPFDLIYAHGVLHHFADPAPLFKKIASLTKRDGILVFSEPSAVNRIYKFARALYRPFQSDSAWEWPFTDKTVSELYRHFEPAEAFGWGRKSLPLSLLVGVPLLGHRAKPHYIAAVESEVADGLSPHLWKNSYVTGMFRKKHDTE